MAQQKINFPTEIFETLDNEVMEQEYPDQNFAELIPVNEVDENTEALANLSVDWNGKAEPVSGKYGEKLPVIDFTADKDSIKVIDFGMSFIVNLVDIRAATSALVNFDPIRTKLQGMNLAYRTALYDVAITGNDKLKFKGLMNADGIESTPVGAGGTWEGTKTASQIVDDLMRGYNKVLTQTLNHRRPDTVVMPLTAFTAANSLRLNSGEGISAIQAFRNGVRDSGGGDITIRTNNAAGKDMLFYDFDPLVLRMNMAKELTYLEEQWVDLGYKVPAYFRFSGVQIRNTQAFHKVTGVIA